MDDLPGKTCVVEVLRAHFQISIVQSTSQEPTRLARRKSLTSIRHELIQARLLHLWGFMILQNL